MKYLIFLLVSFLCFLGNTSFASGTVVGNGGDPIFDFMEAARNSMIETVKLLANEPAQAASFCESETLNEAQIQFCRNFFKAVSQEILVLSQGHRKTPFVLREEPLFVEGPDGKPMMVAARTALGPAGPIELHRDSVKTLVPVQALLLIAHEFQHKVRFQGRSVTDNEHIGPFATGRELIGAVSAGIVLVARKNGKVGSQFGIRDIFDCRVLSSGELRFGARISSTRLFKTEDLMTYETSAGKNPLDGSIYVPESAETSLILRFVITEPNNCGESHSQRKTVVQIIRSTKVSEDSTQEAIVATEVLNVNPMCPKTNPEFEISKDRLQFACRYFGSEGTTSSVYSLRFGPR
jgi:hypothetical protein